MKITEYLKENIIYLDGGMGTLLQERGLAPGELPELWNITRSEIITEIHKAYFDAGTNVVNTNTFGANSLKLTREELERVISSAIANARAAAELSRSSQPKWIALDVGPLGRMLRPYGDLDFEDAVTVFSETVKLGAKYGADLIFIETMNDSYETKAALLAAKESCDLPVFVSNAYGEDGKLMTGSDPVSMVALLEGMGADAIGVNCSLGPAALAGVVGEYLKYASIPVLMKPNAGLPKSVAGKTVYDLSAESFADAILPLVKQGVRLVGGCCGTTPEYIRKTVEKTARLRPKDIESKNVTLVSSYTHSVEFGKSPVLIGERINPTGKKRFKEALISGDIDYILREGALEEEAGAHVLDVNVGLPEIDEPAFLTRAVTELQAITDLPLQIDTADPMAMEAALRRYNGKPMINSVNGKQESMNAVFPLVKKYGGVLVALTLDEGGIPSTAEGRVEIARKILAEAERFGIAKKDIIFDPLALTVSADPSAPGETLRAIEIITRELGCHTSLGVSNVSFGLPARDTVNATFFAMALTGGLSAAIMNPHSAEMMKVYHSYRALTGIDESCADYIKFAEAIPVSNNQTQNAKKAPFASDFAETLSHAIIKGMAPLAARLAEKSLSASDPLTVVNEEIIPALNTVGVGFEEKRIYLPGLLMSAEAAGAAFEVVKSKMSGNQSAKKCPLVIATVKGDIHDIGKNIVKLLLENYGFDVVDLGRDVAPEKIVAETVRLHAPIVGLSALMTTTVPAMEETVRQLRESAPWCKIMVGGAVLTPEYAKMIGADAYAKDAMEAVRAAEELYAKCKITPYEAAPKDMQTVSK